MNQGWLVSGELSLLSLALHVHPGQSTVHIVRNGAISHSKENFSDEEMILFWGGKNNKNPAHCNKLLVRKFRGKTK